jgi:signal transduction histidine kinase
VALALYGMPGQLFTRPSPLFPSNVLNSELFWDVTGIPIQFFRATLAMAMALAFIRAMRVFELESRQRLAAARAERRAAQEEAITVQRQARRTTEQLNSELQLAVRNLSVLHALARDLSATLDAEIMLQEVFPAFIRGEQRVGAGMVILKDSNGVPEVRVKTICHAAPEDKDAMETAAREMGQRVIERERPGYWNQESYRDILDSVDQPWPPDETNVRVIGIPLVRQEEIIGAMLVCVFPGLSPFSTRDYALFSTAARQLSAALQNAALFAETQQREKLRARLLQQVVTAQEQERQRIARELHDGPGQTLTALGLGLAGTATQVEHNQEAAARQLNDLKGLSTHALQELRDIIADLRPSVLDDLGLLPALRSQIQLLEERIDIDATLKVTGDRRRLPTEIETIIFRIIQEALTNIAKHARAGQATVQLHFNPATVEIEVKDDGRGFEPTRILRPGNNRHQGWGVLGMQERASLVGGTCTIESEPGVGTTVYVEIPLTGLNRNEHGQDKATSR